MSCAEPRRALHALLRFEDVADGLPSMPLHRMRWQDVRRGRFPCDALRQRV